MLRRLPVILFLTISIFLEMGCAALVSKRLRDKIPLESAKNLSVTVNIVGAGGGTLAASGIRRADNGGVIVSDYQETITTAGGQIAIKADEVILKP